MRAQGSWARPKEGRKRAESGASGWPLPSIPGSARPASEPRRPLRPVRWAGVLGGGLGLPSQISVPPAERYGALGAPLSSPSKAVHPFAPQTVLRLSVNLEPDAGPGEGGQTALPVRAVCKPTPCAWVYVPASAGQPGLLLGSASLRQESSVAYFCSMSGKGAPWAPLGGHVHTCALTQGPEHARRGGTGLRPQVWPPICRGRRLNGAELRGSRP